MARSEFRWNKKRKHYAYLFKDLGDYRVNILISTDQVLIEKKHGKIITVSNIVLNEHPNPNKRNDGKNYYLVNHKPYIDHKDSFAPHIYIHWRWGKHDKRKVKRMQKYKKHQKYYENYKK